MNRYHLVHTLSLIFEDKFHKWRDSNLSRVQKEYSFLYIFFLVVLLSNRSLGYLCSTSYKLKARKKNPVLCSKTIIRNSQFMTTCASKHLPILFISASSYIQFQCIIFKIVVITDKRVLLRIPRGQLLQKTCACVRAICLNFYFFAVV